MSDNFNAKLTEIKHRTDIVEIISQYLVLKKAGRNYWGLCPFHQEKTPSFSVNPEKQFFHCFGCGKGGDVVTFLMEAEQLSYWEAMQRLARRLGVALPQRPDKAQHRSAKGKLLAINKIAGAFFANNLQGATAKAAREYLAKRGLPKEVCKDFQIGFAPDGWSNLKNYLEREKASLTDAFEVGLLAQRDDGGYYDRFRNRLIFPIQSTGGDIIAFGGRVLAEGEPKYLNSPESPIYSKGSNLYGLFQAKEHIAAAGLAIIVEGYLDLLTLYASGIRNIVATLGTALGEAQVRLLKRYCANACLLFDGDDAGQRAMVRSWEIFTTGGMEAKAVALPEGKDPDDFIKENGAEALLEKIAKAETLSDYFFQNTIGKAQGAAQLNAAIRELAPLILGIGDEIARGIFIRGIVEKSGVSEAALHRAVTAAQKKATKTRERITAGKENDVTSPPQEHFDNREVDILRIMAEFTEVVEIVENEDILSLFTSEYLKNIGEMIISAYKINGKVDVLGALSRLDDDVNRAELLKHLTTGAPCDTENSKATVQDIINGIKIRNCRRQFRELTLKLQAMEKAGDTMAAQLLLSQLQEIKAQEKILTSR